MADDKEKPATETRGGEKPDWANAEPGQPLPEKPGNLAPDQCGGACGDPGCEPR